MADPSLIPDGPGTQVAAGSFLLVIGGAIRYAWEAWRKSQRDGADIRKQDTDADISLSERYDKFAERLDRRDAAWEARCGQLEARIVQLEGDAARHSEERIAWLVTQRQLEAERNTARADAEVAAKALETSQKRVAELEAHVARLEARVADLERLAAEAGEGVDAIERRSAAETNGASS